MTLAEAGWIFGSFSAQWVEGWRRPPSSLHGPRCPKTSTELRIQPSTVREGAIKPAIAGVRAMAGPSADESINAA
jgi:hypothetical protein